MAHRSLSGLVPEVVAVAATRGETVAEELWPGEHACVADAVPSRRREFALGRTCARIALARLGHAPIAIPAGHDRAPQWPAAVVGSITHCTGYTAAAVAPAERIRAIGIDAEPWEQIEPGVSELIVSADERSRLEGLGLPPVVAFSAKEAAFKAWWPLTGVWLDFLDVELEVDARSGSFRAEVGPRRPGLPDGIEGRFTHADGLVLCAAIVDA